MGHLTKSPNSAVGTRLDTDLTPASDRQIFDELEALFLSFGTDAERLGQKRVALYVDACRGEPVWAVRKGIEKVRKGRDDGKTTDFLPSTQRVAREVRGESDWARERVSRHQRLERQKAAAPAADTLHEKMGPEARAVVDHFLRKSRELQQEDAK
jgi:hypothetical protein